MRRVWYITAAAVSVLAASGHSVRAQGVALHPYPELRLDALLGQPGALQLGVGVAIPMGTYARLAVIGAGGVASQDGETAGSARADVIMRFLLDPFRQERWGLSAGGGVSVRYDEGAGWRPFLALVLDLEGPRTGALSPAVQLGLGGGARIGVVLRASGSHR